MVFVNCAGFMVDETMRICWRQYFFAVWEVCIYDLWPCLSRW